MRPGSVVPPSAWLTGYGNACDAYHQTASSPEDTGAQMAMREALAMAGMVPGDIQWVHAHGTGTQNNDSSEVVAIDRVFGDTTPLVTSTKRVYGPYHERVGCYSRRYQYPRDARRVRSGVVGSRESNIQGYPHGPESDKNGVAERNGQFVRFWRQRLFAYPLGFRQRMPA